MTRTREGFDGSWRFFRGEINVPETVKSGVLGGLADVAGRQKGKHNIVAFVDKEMARRADPEKWPEVTLPHDWAVENPIVNDPENVLHGFRPRGVGFYRKVFALPEKYRGRKVILEFDGVFRASTVWLNGHSLREHRSGYTSFSVDITDAARYGEEGGNCLLVRVDARATEGWWYEGCGIYRHVWLVTTDRIHVARWGTYVTTPRVTERRAMVRVETTLANENPWRVAATLETSLVDRRGQRVARARRAVSLPADGRAVAIQAIEVPRPELWSPETPALYRALTEVKVAGRAVDRYSTTFGVRTIRFSPDDGFFLNGRSTPIKGMCNHQDFAGVGVALPDSIHEYKIRLLKEMGCNAYRCAHHPPAPELLDACDRLGMMVMDENRKLDSSPTGLADLESMILRDRNHPSVIVWGMENEEYLEGTPQGARIVDRLARLTRRIDPTRPTVAAQNHGHVWEYSGKLDLAGFNYGNGGKDVAYHARHPRQPVIGTETNATPSDRGIYEDDPKRGYVNAYGTTVSPPPYQWNTGFDVSWRAYLEHRFLTGVFVWTGFDYRGEPSPYKWPCVNSHYGVMDTCGFPKDGYYYHRAMFTEEPVLHLMPHWTWPGKTGKEIRVWVLTNVERVELLLNGRSLGIRRVQHGAPVERPVRYEPGELKGVGFRGGRRVVETKVETTSAAARVHLDPDRDVLRADGRDAVPIRVAILDAAGRVVPDARPLVKFAVEGPARIIGVGNGDPASHEPDKAEKRRAFSGRCLAIIQSTGRKGGVRFTARATGLKTATARLRAR